MCKMCLHTTKKKPTPACNISCRQDSKPNGTSGRDKLRTRLKFGIDIGVDACAATGSGPTQLGFLFQLLLCLPKLLQKLGDRFRAAA